ncbi:MAG: RluA family pseudouridine synthase [Pseudomonadota bacterium]
MNKPAGNRGEKAPRTLKVTARADGQRLDNFLLRELKGVPRGLLYRLVRQGAIRVDGRRSKVHQRIQAGSEVRVPDLDRPQEARLAVPPKVLDRLRQAIVYEDDRYLVLDKPSGLAVHGGSGLSFGIIEAMRQLRPDAELELGHRLDRETSGCLLLAKRRDALQAFHEALREGRVEKRYLALVVGSFAETVPVECDLPVAPGRDAGGRKRMSAGPDVQAGRVAHSVFRPLEHYGAFQLVEVGIGTGRTHQIRVHGQALGHPVAGDHDYGLPDANRTLRQHGLDRLFLHAQALRFEEASGEEHVFSAPLPEALNAVLASLAGQGVQGGGA